MLISSSLYFSKVLKLKNFLTFFDVLVKTISILGYSCISTSNYNITIFITTIVVTLTHIDSHQWSRKEKTRNRLLSLAFIDFSLFIFYSKSFHFESFHYYWFWFFDCSTNATVNAADTTTTTVAAWTLKSNLKIDKVKTKRKKEKKRRDRFGSLASSNLASHSLFLSIHG